MALRVASFRIKLGRNGSESTAAGIATECALQGALLHLIPSRFRMEFEDPIKSSYSLFTSCAMHVDD